MNAVKLTKYQSSMIAEKMCPGCRGELDKISRGEYSCTKCRTVYVSSLEEEKKGDNASH